VYRLHRETFHLAASYVDRYLNIKKDIKKSRLQLVGVTALFIAAKLEEIYPPKLSEFSYVTDGACTDDEIIVQELVMMKVGCLSTKPLTFTWKDGPSSTFHFRFAHQVFNNAMLCFIL
jgi:cyclin E